MINEPKKILNDVFGFDIFLPLQERVIENILNKNDTLVIVPTGGGKSLCFQIPALIFDGLTIVISPLISLMKDQVDQLKETGVSAVFLNSSLSASEYNENFQLVKQNKVKLLYMAPEALLKNGMLDILRNVKVDCITIDEAHCISSWGHDFRPEYRKIIETRSCFPDAVYVAFTATATPRVRDDIKHNLHFNDSNEFISGFNRDNLFIQVKPKQNPADQTLRFLGKHKDQSGIIYCYSRKQVDDLTIKLTEAGFSALPYHAGMTEFDRNKNQDAFIRDDVQIIVATIAFGMGIDKPTVRFVIHYDMPKNIESYYQEIGRSGRDGIQSDCLLLFSYGDIQKIKHFIKDKNEHEQRIANIQLNAMVSLAETEECRRIPLLHYFGEDYHIKNCDMCDNCTSEKKEVADITVPAQMFLSCVKRTGEMFGAQHIIDVLRGANSKKILNFNHQELSTYNIGKKYTKKQWFQISRQLLHKKLMEHDMEFGGLRLTDKAWEVFRGEMEVFGRIDEDLNDDFKNKKIKKGNSDLPDHHLELFQILRKKRKEIADQSNVAPYILFSDRSLIEMSVYFPRSEESLLTINGVGQVKIDKYGGIFLEMIQSFCEHNNIQEVLKETPGKKISEKTEPENKKKKRYVEVGELFNKGSSIPDIMKSFDTKKKTVIMNLYQYVMNGNELNKTYLLNNLDMDHQSIDKIINAFEEFGTEYLKPVYEYFNGRIQYDDIEIARLIYLNKRI